MKQATGNEDIISSFAGLPMLLVQDLLNEGDLSAGADQLIQVLIIG